MRAFLYCDISTTGASEIYLNCRGNTDPDSFYRSYSNSKYVTQDMFKNFWGYYAVSQDFYTNTFAREEYINNSDGDFYKYVPPNEYYRVDSSYNMLYFFKNLKILSEGRGYLWQFEPNHLYKRYLYVKNTFADTLEGGFVDCILDFETDMVKVNKTVIDNGNSVAIYVDYVNSIPSWYDSEPSFDD